MLHLYLTRCREATPPTLPALVMLPIVHEFASTIEDLSRGRNCAAAWVDRVAVNVLVLVLRRVAGTWGNLLGVVRRISAVVGVVAGSAEDDLFECGAGAHRDDLVVRDVGQDWHHRGGRLEGDRRYEEWSSLPPR
jgi:hypothetical protein